MNTIKSFNLLRRVKNYMIKGDLSRACSMTYFERLALSSVRVDKRGTTTKACLIWLLSLFFKPAWRLKHIFKLMQNFSVIIAIYYIQLRYSLVSWIFSKVILIHWCRKTSLRMVCIPFYFLFAFKYLSMITYFLQRKSCHLPYLFYTCYRFL